MPTSSRLACAYRSRQARNSSLRRFNWAAGSLAEYTTDLLNVLNVLGLLVDLEPQAEQLLERICAGPLISHAELQAAGAYFPEGFVSATAPAQGDLDL